jgi:DNA gyrase subunit A
LSQDNTAPAPPASAVSTISIEEEMKRSYLDYAMSVIVSRALPDVRDGLKPVHRRILYAMKDGGYDSSKPYKKSARIVGDVMGKYHPHGDSAIYDAMVRMAQDFSMRLPLIDGQGNFGSMDGDPPAAMRYTEARLGKTAETLLEDIDKDTVSFQANYDESIQEPTVLPARFPNLLINGAGGIAVGMATNIPTHNLGEVIDATIATIDNPDITIDELMDIVPGPDFPTGGIILGRNGVRSAMHTGRGSVVIRSRTLIEEIRKDREAIIVTEIPYQVNKSRLLEIIASQVNDKVIEGIADLRDESDRDGVRIVIELKRDAVADIVLNQLYKHSPLQTSFGVNMLALRDGRPELLNIKQVLEAFLVFREQVITRRTEYELSQARDRAHILVGLAVAVANIDEVIALIRKAPDPQEARAQLMAREWNAENIAPVLALVEGDENTVPKKTYKLSENQAKAILDLRLHRLTGLERDKIAADLKEVVTRIADYLDILRNRPRVLQIMRDEMLAIKQQFNTPRRTTIEELEFEEDIEALIQREDMVVTVSHTGYVKRVPLSTYRAQKRGGKGRMGMATKDEDFVNDIFIANTHTPMLFFSSRGMVYELKVYKLPLGNPQAKGKAFVNLLPLQQGETITATLRMPEDESTWQNLYAMFATTSGTVRRNRLSDFGNIRQSGLIAMKLEEGERLISVHTCTEQDDVLLATRLGKSIRFSVEEIRIFSGRTSMGVRGIKLSDKDEVISMSIVKHTEASPEERLAYLKASAAQRRAESGEAEAEEAVADDEGNVTAITLSPERMRELAASEQFILTVSAQGFGKRTSSYEYRISGRGGSGIWGMNMGSRNTAIMASFPVETTQDLMLVTNGGQVIRMPVKDIRIAGRATQGVTLFRVGENEQVVSAALIQQEQEEANDETGANGK